MTHDDFKQRLAHWGREPLIHFLLAGIAVFLLSAWRGEAVDPASRSITISAADVDQRAQAFAQTWQRPPTPAEIDGLIRDSIKEEVYYREALRLGLDADDSVIRRRLRAKMEYLATSAIETATPDDATLQAWLDRNPARYAAEARFSFDHVYLAASSPTAAALRDRLNQGTEWQTAGDAVALPRSFERAGRTEIASRFGDGFADALAGLKPGSWSGPIASGVGTHIVRIRAAEAGTPPKLSEVRQRVENDWRSATAKAREAKAYQTLLDSYRIRIEKP